MTDGPVTLPVADGESQDGSRVGGLELFFALVFACGITQLATVLVNDRAWAGRI